MTAHARVLRTQATDAERLIWLRLSRYRPRFTRQLVVGPFILDLACRAVQLAVEFDGSQHVASSGDVRRTAWLAREGWTVLRFWNTEVAQNPDGVALAILDKVAALLGDTHPRPLPRREGRKRCPTDSTAA